MGTGTGIRRTDRKAWAREHFRGLENVVMPSFSPDLSKLDEAGIRLDIAQSIRHGVFSSLCSVETGLSSDERRDFLAIAADEAGDAISVGVSLTGETLEENIALLADAEEAGCSHGLISFPQGFAPREEQDVLRYVKALSDSTDLGLYLFISDKFDFQRFHPSGVPFAAYDQAVELDNIVAIKLGGMDLGMICEVFDRYNDAIPVAAINLGMLPLLVETYGQQWSGAWTIEALQSPDRPYAVDFFDALVDGRSEEAMALYWRLAPAMGVMMQLMAPLIPTGMYHWPQLKFFQFCTGGNGGVTRQPSMRLSKRDMDLIRNGFRAIGIDPQGSDEEFFEGRVNAGAVLRPPA